jgi:ubiquinone/menaquinone biosynthesis C-methylase UbiE
MQLDNFYKYSVQKNSYATQDRVPFFALALKYCRLSKKEDPVIVDIGSGEGDFYDFLKKNNFSTKNLFLLDSNEKTVEKNKASLTNNSFSYIAPQKLPFENNSVDVVHTSHLIEYLAPGEMYSLMQEMDRVLIAGGYLVISAPLIWDNFYNDLGHLRPYSPFIFHKYFINLSRNNRLDKISNSYETKELAYRYYQLPLDEGWSSSIPFIDYMITGVKRILGKLGIRKLGKNGYTLIMQKID